MRMSYKLCRISYISKHSMYVHMYFINKQIFLSFAMWWFTKLLHCAGPHMMYTNTVLLYEIFEFLRNFMLYAMLLHMG